MRGPEKLMVSHHFSRLDRGVVLLKLIQSKEGLENFTKLTFKLKGKIPIKPM